jgi:hypothetical protein
VFFLEKSVLINKAMLTQTFPRNVGKKVKQCRYRPGVAQRVLVKQCRYRPGVAQRISMKLRFTYFLPPAQENGKLVSLTHRPHLPPGNTYGTHFR